MFLWCSTCCLVLCFSSIFQFLRLRSFCNLYILVPCTLHMYRPTDNHKVTTVKGHSGKQRDVPLPQVVCYVWAWWETWVHVLLLHHSRGQHLPQQPPRGQPVHWGHPGGQGVQGVGSHHRIHSMLLGPPSMLPVMPHVTILDGREKLFFTWCLPGTFDLKIPSNISFYSSTTMSKVKGHPGKRPMLDILGLFLKLNS